MKTGTKIGLILGGTLLVLGFAVIAAVVGFTIFSASSGTQRAREDFKKQTAGTDGTITNVSLSSASKIYTYKYVVNGVSYTGEWMTTRSKIENNYLKDIGRKGMVCYDPSAPGNSDFYYSDLYEYGAKKGQKMVCGVASQ